jgi:nucleoid-associated protein YgaU
MESAEAGRKSPDLTHIRIVREGDTLPGLCEDIYNDPAYYLEVARFNRLGSFRNLEIGSEIYFPQLR